MKPLTVFQITSSGNNSGGTRQSMFLSEGLKAAGHRVVFCAPTGSPALALAEKAGFECRDFVKGKFWTQWRSSRRVRKFVAETGADVVHAHHTVGHNVALLATFGGPFPPVVANRGVLFDPHFPTKFRTRRTAAITTNSAAVKRVLERFGVDGAKIHIVYNARDPIDLNAVRARAEKLRDVLCLAGSGPVIGTVGGGRPEKGFQFLVEAAPRILEQFPDAVFVLVGGNTELFRPRLEELGILDRFRLPGHRSDAVDFMALFHVFVIPSVGMESCPNVLLEAMAVGLPAVGADTGGIGEMIVSGETGQVVPPRDADAIAEAVNQILRTPDLAQEMGQAARERIARHFSLEQKVQATLAVYDEVLSCRERFGG